MNHATNETLSPQRLEQFRAALQHDYDQEPSEEEAAALAAWLIRFFTVLIKMTAERQGKQSLELEKATEEAIMENATHLE